MLSSHAASSTDEHTQKSNILPSEEQHQPKTDGRITNKGSLERRSYTNTEKFMLVDEVSRAIQNGCKNAQKYFTGAGYTYEQARLKTNNYNKWKANAVKGEEQTDTHHSRLLRQSYIDSSRK